MYILHLRYAVEVAATGSINKATENPRQDLVEKKCANNVRKYKDVFICRSDYRLTETDKSFIKELKKEKNNII